MSQHSLLLVDDDPKSLRLLEVSLRRAGFRVVTAQSGLDALSRMSTRPDALVLDAAMPDMDGFELCALLRQDPQHQSLPVLFLVRENSIEDRTRALELGADDFVMRPAGGTEVARRVQLMLARKACSRLARGEDLTSAVGRLDDVGVPDLVSAVDVGKRTGVLRLRRNSQEGSVWFREGRAVDASCGAAQGERAFFRVLLWASGAFEFAAEAVAPEHVRITLGTQALLQEGLRRLVEWDRVREQLPALREVFEVNYHSLAQRLAEIPDEVNGVLRLFDGHRSMVRVAEDAPFDDLTSLNVIAKLYMEGLLVPLVAATPVDEATQLDAWIARAPGVAPSRAAEALVADEAAAAKVAADEAATAAKVAADEAAKAATRVAQAEAAAKLAQAEAAAKLAAEEAAQEAAQKAAAALVAQAEAAAAAKVAAEAAAQKAAAALVAQAEAAAKVAAEEAARKAKAEERMGHLIEFPRTKARAEEPSLDTHEVATEDGRALKARPVEAPSEPPRKEDPVPAVAAQGADPSSITLPDLAVPLTTPAPVREAASLSVAPAAEDDVKWFDGGVAAREDEDGSRGRGWLWVGGGIAAAAIAVWVVLGLRAGDDAPISRGALEPTGKALASRLEGIPPEVLAVPVPASPEVTSAAVQAPPGMAADPSSPPPATKPAASAPAAPPAIAAQPVLRVNEPKPAPTRIVVAAPADKPEPKTVSLAELLKKGNVLMRRNQHDAASKAFADAAKAHPNSAEAHYGLGRALYERGSEAASVPHLERAVRIKPSLAGAYVHLGSAYQLKQQTQKARGAYETYLKLAPRGKHAEELRGLLKGM